VRDEEFETFVDRVRNDDEVLALVLGGGRGKGVWTPESDYDVYLVVADGVDVAEKRHLSPDDESALLDQGSRGDRWENSARRHRRQLGRRGIAGPRDNGRPLTTDR
jgi:hypothetical protein